jgi:hypothetical protein
MPNELKTVGFQVDLDYWKRLEEEVTNYRSDFSPHQFARKIVMDYLNDAEREKIKERLGGVEESLEVLRVGLVNSVEMLLVQTGMTEGEAEAYINDTFRRR